MSSSLRLDASLKVLKDAGHKIGAPHITESGEMRIPIDNVPLNFEKIFQLADEYAGPFDGPLTGNYVRMTLAPKTRRGTLGKAKREFGGLVYLFHIDDRFFDKMPAAFYPPTEFEICPRPSDEEVAEVNAKLKRSLN
jgi:hypothetical protein